VIPAHTPAYYKKLKICWSDNAESRPNFIQTTDRIRSKQIQDTKAVPARVVVEDYSVNERAMQEKAEKEKQKEVELRAKKDQDKKEKEQLQKVKQETRKKQITENKEHLPESRTTRTSLPSSPVKTSTTTLSSSATQTPTPTPPPTPVTPTPTTPTMYTPASVPTRSEEHMSSITLGVGRNHHDLSRLGNNLQKTMSQEEKNRALNKSPSARGKGDQRPPPSKGL